MWIWDLLTLPNTDDDLAHDFEFLPIDASVLSYADVGFVTLLSENEISSVKWQKGDSRGRSIRISQSVREMTFLRSHQYLEAHEFLL